MDLVIEKATELGVQTIMPFVSASTVAHLPLERQAERLCPVAAPLPKALPNNPAVRSRISIPLFLCASPDCWAPNGRTLLLYEHEHTDTLRAFAESHPDLSAVWIIVGSEGGLALRKSSKPTSRLHDGQPRAGDTARRNSQYCSCRPVPVCVEIRPCCSTIPLNSPQFPSCLCVSECLACRFQELLSAQRGSTEHAALAFCLHHGPDPKRSD